MDANNKRNKADFRSESSVYSRDKTRIDPSISEYTHSLYKSKSKKKERKKKKIVASKCSKRLLFLSPRPELQGDRRSPVSKDGCTTLHLSRNVAVTLVVTLTETKVMIKLARKRLKHTTVPLIMCRRDNVLTQRFNNQLTCQFTTNL